MLSFIYNFALVLFGVFSLPKLIWERKKYQDNLFFKLGFKLPRFSRAENKRLIWIHAVSLGETRAAISLFDYLKKNYPEAQIVISSTTQTGHEEAKRSLKEADLHFYLPLDFSWVMRRLLRIVRPDVLILMEGEFWYHLLSIAKELKTHILVANGKLSERSLDSFSFIPFFSKRLFAPIDHFCVQSPCHFDRFRDIGIDPKKLTVTGNLKFDTPLEPLTPSEKDYFREELGITGQDRVVVIASTHDQEEEKILQALQPLWKEIPHLKLLLVPRHPERFLQVKNVLEKYRLPFITYTNRKQHNQREKVVLIDAMGLLTTCYQLAEVALVGGSFVRGIGGHNVFEPIQCGVPVIFGPHMESQRDFADLILRALAGRQLNLEELPHILKELLHNGSMRAHMRACGQKLKQSAQGAIKRTCDSFSPYFEALPK
jgi:3-deoxy-D-manno-octulosonic-acid transferase